MKKKDLQYDGYNKAWEDRNRHSPQVTFGQVCYHAGGYCGPRIQQDYQLVMLYSGSCSVQIDQASYPLSVGSIYLFKPRHREHFIFSSDTQTRHFWCTIRPAAVPLQLRQSLDASPFCPVAASECMRHIIASAFALYASETASTRAVINALAQSLFAEFLHLLGHEEHKDVNLARAIRYMEEHLGEADCLRGSQKASGCSVTTLIGKFKTLIGKTPDRYLWQLRTEAGLGMLIQTGLSIQEISTRCGFSNPFHFSRHVRYLRGKSPKSIRQAAWNASHAMD